MILGSSIEHLLGKHNERLLKVISSNSNSDDFELSRLTEELKKLLDDVSVMGEM
jgi:hypothetical protein